MLRTSLSLTALLISTVTATAGGTAPPPAPPVVVPPAPTDDFSGLYGGVLLGYASGTYGNDTNFPGDGEGDWDGALYGIALGYNLQNGNIVYGGEFTYSGGEIDGTEDCVNPAFQCIGEIDSIATIRGRVGYVFGPSTMVYGTLGYAVADVNFSTDGGTRLGENRDLDGYVAGVGVEHALSRSLSLRGAVLYYDFRRDTFQTDVTYDDIGGDVTEIELGLMYRF